MSFSSANAKTVVSRRDTLGIFDIFAPIVFGLVLLGAWIAVTTLGKIPAFILPTPQAVVRAAMELFASATFWPYLGNTLAEAIAGTVLGLVVSLPLAFTIHHLPWLNAAVQPFLGASQAVPAVALAPLLLIWLPASFLAIVVLCAIMVFFPILVSTTVGLRHLEGHILEAAMLDGADTWQLLKYMELPLVLPSLMGGIRNGITLSITGAVVGEMVIGGHGMGTLITLQSHNVDTSGMFVSLFTICTLAAGIYLAVYRLERHSKTVNAV
ncbi:MAG: ABC transporter permease [Mobiluncus porci]|uniref:ABC transporter permease n=1 Tax=Mobiluncus porci TaxID=2652278 RepID=UPI0023F57E9F|nr:ABC transporter permease [Mobiluncus porci]MDD7541824.1 ABC transporter permease [Mobiluncus porci]MDY5748672.1 ABC transporter permease [Mobiluncus porci]